VRRESRGRAWGKQRLTAKEGRDTESRSPTLTLNLGLDFLRKLLRDPGRRELETAHIGGHYCWTAITRVAKKGGFFAAASCLEVHETGG